MFTRRKCSKNRSLRTACSQAAVFFFTARAQFKARPLRLWSPNVYFSIPRRPEAARRLYIKNTGEKGLQSSWKNRNFPAVMHIWTYAHNRSRNWFIYIIGRIVFHERRNGHGFILINITMAFYFKMVYERLATQQFPSNFRLHCFSLCLHAHENFKLRCLSIAWFKPFLVLSWESWRLSKIFLLTVI